MPTPEDLASYERDLRPCIICGQLTDRRWYEVPHCLNCAYDELPQTFDQADPLTDERADYALGPVALAERWARRIESGDPYALDVQDAVVRWEASQREARRMRSAYRDAIGRGDSPAAAKAWDGIQRVKASRRDRNDRKAK